MIITLCGSAKFEHGYVFWNKKLSLDGHVVFSLAAMPSTQGGKDWYTEKQKTTLDAVHMKKIDASEAIFVIDEWKTSETYTGHSTQNEIAYAIAHNKQVFFSSVTCPHPDCPGRLIQRSPCDVCRPPC